MLLEFKTKNYKSFKDDLVFSMVPAPKQKGLDYSILKKTVGKKEYKALSCSVIYGPNAAGKTNIISAMDTFKSIVQRGNINNGNPNFAANRLELIPCNLVDNPRPVFFSIKFIQGGLLIEYGFEIDLGGFLETEYDRKIVSEFLNVNEKPIYTRQESVISFYNLNEIKEIMISVSEKEKQLLINIAQQNINDKELFLLNGFKNMFSSQLVSKITGWLNKKFNVLYKSAGMSLRPVIKTTDTDKAAKCFGIDTNGLGYLPQSEDKLPILSSFFNSDSDSDSKNRVIPSDIYESQGTLRFIDLYTIVARVLENGGILVADEFDASIHPKVIMSLINVFHNDDINVNKAQLIFNTHNPMFMNKNLLRRDEIKFVERDENAKSSVHYSLSDFKTSGTKGVRKDSDYVSNYFTNRYGAILDIDLNELFKNIVTTADSGNGAQSM